MRDSVYQVLDDFIYEEIKSQIDLGSSKILDWEFLKQRFAAYGRCFL